MPPYGVRVSDFDFDLPERLIAQHPRARGESRLLVVDRAAGAWHESRVADLPRWLKAGDLLVANDSRVFPARLLGRRVPGGGRAECLLLERENDLGENDLGENDLRGRFGANAHETTSEVVFGGVVFEVWSALVKPGPKLLVGARIDFTDPARAPGVSLTGTIEAIDDTGRRRVRLVAEGASVADAIDRLGHIPLPPYIRRPDTDDDRARYQTMFSRLRPEGLRRGFARFPGSIAAPTAGLHFDEGLIAALETAGVGKATVTLHVGYGTFKPVTVEDTADHRVDAERYEVTAATAEAITRARAAGGRLVAVGTTTTRALESAARETGAVTAGSGRTELVITPGYEFRAIDALLTNFHLPQSSLLMLVAAFTGRDLLLAAYRDAVARDFAFYSYGDAMLIV
ncbi:MAG TPA: tRNA preQ1(34) S-adenosylmethionine ribosyltransferase-isomerase QueA [Vicinamibacterales bacterium]|nr:tRNA preQ1(34) S-adenosylmethionine ribosyltransferase-isomerase QueA [Vicinamibacterales bacterium]